MTGCSERGNETSGSVKHGELLDKLNDFTPRDAAGS